MNRLSLLISGLAFLAIFTFSMCGSNGEAAEESGDTTINQLEQKMDNLEASDSTKANLGKEYTAKYVCPMHCKGSGGDKAGACSECGMDMIENPGNQK